jgi:hypothetical protein
MSTKDELTKVQFGMSLITPKGTMEMVNVLLNLTMFVLGWFSITVEVFLRFAFGERYLSLLRLCLAYMTFQVFQTLYFLLGWLFGFAGNPMNWLFNSPDLSTLFAGGVHSLLYHLFVYGFFGLSALHLITIAKRENAGQEWHTASFGVSWLTYLPWDAWDALVDTVFLLVGRVWNALLQRVSVPLVRNSLEWFTRHVPVTLIKSTLQVDDWKLYRFLEPLLCYLMAKALQPTDGLLGTWLLIASIALFIKNNMMYFDMRGRMLDHMDSHIESVYLQAALKREDKRLTGGFTVVPVPMRFVDSSEIDPSVTVQETLGHS